MRRVRNIGDCVRSRLVDQVNGTTGVVLIDAPSGFGKSTLLMQLAGGGGGAVLAGLDDTVDDLCDASGIDSELRILIDDVNGEADVGHLLADRRVATLVVAGRSIGHSVRRQVADYLMLELNGRDLRFDDDELHRVLDAALVGLPQAATVRMLGAVTEGWPVAVRVAIDALEGRQDDRALAQITAHGPHLSTLVAQCFADLSPEVAKAFLSLGHLEVFTSACVETLAGPGAVEAARMGGCPVLRSADGWLRLPEVVRRAIRVQGELQGEVAKAVAPVLISSGGVTHGLRVLVEAELFDEAATTLVALPSSSLDDIDPQLLLGLLEILEHVVESWPRMHLIAARVHRNMANLVAQRHALETAASLDVSLHPDIVLDAELDLLLMKAREGWDAQDEAHLAELTSGEMTVGPGHRAQANEIRALLLAQSPTPRDARSSVEIFERASAEWLVLGDPSRAASCLRSVAATALTHLGDYQRASALLLRAGELSWNRVFDRALTGVLQCRIDALAGKVESVDLRLEETNSLVRMTGLSWLRCYLAWAEMLRYSLTSDRTTAVARCDGAAALMGELSTHPTGVVFAAEAAVAMAFVGEQEAAGRYLAQAVEGRAMSPVDVAVAEVTVAARKGCVDEVAELTSQYANDPLFPAERRWRLDLEQAIALTVAGRNEEAAASLEAARARSTTLGLGEFAERILSRVDLSDNVQSLTVQVLGDFRVRRDGRQLDIPAGHPSTLLKLLAIQGRRVSVDQVIDVLWPNTPLASGRRRLKNVVSRLRSVLGAEALERHPDLVGLSDHVVIDIEVFTTRAERLLEATANLYDGDTSQAAKLALDAYKGPLLPHDLYVDWPSAHRETARRQALTVFAKACDLPAPERPAASWLLDTLLRLAPDDDRAMVAVARVALEDQDQDCARTAVRLAAEAANALGVDLRIDSIELESVFASL